MNRPTLYVLELEDRSTPVSLRLGISAVTNIVIGPVDPTSPPVSPPPAGSGTVVVSPPPPVSPPVPGSY
jgi:hypothetical protein